MTKTAIPIILCLVGFASGQTANTQSHIDLEFGYVLPGYNDVAIPGDAGTRFSLTEDLDADPATAFRIRYGRTFSEKHWIGILAAPLTMKSDGTLNKSISFNNTTFPQGSRVDATFRFDSYRLIYRYGLHESDKWKLSLGGALKVRNAAIKLEGPGLVSEKKNTGLVPLLSGNITWMPSERFHVLADGEALASAQGRAEDVLFAVQYGVGKSLAFRTGYRILEGGADNDDVYTFSLFHYLVIAFTWAF